MAFPVTPRIAHISQLTRTNGSWREAENKVQRAKTVHDVLYAIGKQQNRLRFRGESLSLEQILPEFELHREVPKVRKVKRVQLNRTSSLPLQRLERGVQTDAPAPRKFTMLPRIDEKDEEIAALRDQNIHLRHKVERREEKLSKLLEEAKRKEESYEMKLRQLKEQLNQQSELVEHLSERERQREEDVRECSDSWSQTVDIEEKRGEVKTRRSLSKIFFCGKV